MASRKCWRPSLNSGLMDPTANSMSHLTPDEPLKANTLTIQHTMPSWPQPYALSDHSHLSKCQLHLFQVFWPKSLGTSLHPSQSLSMFKTARTPTSPTSKCAQNLSPSHFCPKSPPRIHFSKNHQRGPLKTKSVQLPDSLQPSNDSPLTQSASRNPYCGFQGPTVWFPLPLWCYSEDSPSLTSCPSHAGFQSVLHTSQATATSHPFHMLLTTQRCPWPTLSAQRSSYMWDPTHWYKPLPLLLHSCETSMKLPTELTLSQYWSIFST